MTTISPGGNPYSVELSPGQKEGIEKLAEWMSSFTQLSDEARTLHQAHELAFKTQPIFRVFGYAGTGKTTIIREMVSLSPSKTFGAAAYTGKAAMVMRKTGMRQARTIHSMIYDPVPPDKDKCNELLAAAKAATNKKEKSKYFRELAEARKVTFQLKESPPSYDFIILDECSMIGEEMLNDLLSFKIPLIVLGDPGQLPPIDGHGLLMTEKPDVLLKEVHRQAEGNPIIQFATRARNMVSIPYGPAPWDGGGTSFHGRIAKFNDSIFLEVDQVLTGQNTTRKMLNQRIRGKLGHDLGGIYPVKGEKVICLQNDRVPMPIVETEEIIDGKPVRVQHIPTGASKYQLGEKHRVDRGFIPIYNGMLGEVVEVGQEFTTSIELYIRFETQEPDAKPIRCDVLKAHFDSYHNPEALKYVSWQDKRDCQEFDFGYAITVHKSQGSQWDTVLLYDDRFLSWNRSDRAKWLYTAITRAADAVVVLD